ncbi:MAG: hypothetical protein ACE5JG_06790 [Planctomycetota bacterium]
MEPDAEVHSRSQSVQLEGPLAWVVLVVVLGAALALAAFLFTVFLVAAGVAILAAPLLIWWRRRRLARSGRGTIEVEYTVHPKGTGD